jgi:hypothetical protein
MSVKLNIKRIGKVSIGASVPPRDGVAEPIEAIVLNTNVPPDELARKIVTAGDNTIPVPAVDVVLKNSLNETLSTQEEPAGINVEVIAGDIDLTIVDQDAETYDSKTIVVKDQTVQVNRPPVSIQLNSVEMDTVKSGDGTLNVEVRRATGSTLVGAKQGQYWRIANSVVNIRKSDGVLIEAKSVAAEDTEDAVVADSVVTNDATTPTYTANVKATDGLVLPPQQINVNNIDRGDINSVGAIDINLNVTPNSVGIVGRTVTVEVPSAPPPSTGEFLVRFFDIDGTILKEERRNAGQDATAPPNPDYDPTYLVFAEWNQAFTNVQHDIDVGAIYDTIDGKTYLFLRITDTTGLQPTLQLNKSTTDLMTINWGDTTTNTTTSSGNVNITKTAAYSAVGDYVVTIECAGLHRVNTGGFLLGNNTTYSRSLIKAYLHENFRVDITSSFQAHLSLSIVSISKLNSAIGISCFWQCQALIHVNFPNLVTSLNTVLHNCFSLKSVSYPATITANTGSNRSNYSLQKVVLPNVSGAISNTPFIANFSITKIVMGAITFLSDSSFQNLYAIRKYDCIFNLATIPLSCFTNNASLIEIEFTNSLTSIGQAAFQNNTSCLVYVFNSTTPPTLANINAFTGINAACKIYVPDASVAAYKAATNWATYANYIYPLSTKP